MEHILNRQTTTILTYINQGRRPAAPSPFSLPVRPAAGPVWPRSPRPVRARRAVRRARPRPRRGSCASRRGPSSWSVPRSPRMRKDRAPDHRIRIPRSGDRDAAQRIRTNTGGGEGRNGWMNKYTDMRKGWPGVRGGPGCVARPARAWAGEKRGTPREPVGARPGGTVSCESGGALLSHTLSGAVPSPCRALASGFGMGPGVSPWPWPPQILSTFPGRTPGGSDRDGPGTGQWTRKSVL